MKINNKTAKVLKSDFPIFKNNPSLIYLDSAATSQRPRQVIQTLINFIEKDNANVGRGIYNLSERAMVKYGEAREIVADFINADKEEIVFTKNTTESLNLLAYVIDSVVSKGKNEIVLTEMEHHSNIVPWQQLAKRNKMKLKFIKIKEDFTLDIEDAKKKITNKTAIVSFTHVSNVLGTINPIEEIIKIAKSKKALTILDTAQSISNQKINVKNLDCDFLVFSGHKMLGPTGIGVLYGKKNILKKLRPFLFGGGMIKKVDFKDSEFADIPEKFEAGTQNIGEAIALASAIRYIEKIGLGHIDKWEKELAANTIEKLNEIKGIEIYNPGKDKTAGIVSFNVKGVHPHDVAEILNEKRIAIRAGHMCAMPLMKILKVQGVCRASFSIYNTFEDVEKLTESLKVVKEKFD